MPESPPVNPPAQPRIFDQYADQRGDSAAQPTPAIDRDPKTGRFLKPGFTGHLVAQARQLGISDDELDEMSAADLRAELRDRAFDAKIDKVFNLRQTARQLSEPAKIEPVPQAYVSKLTAENSTDEIRAEFAEYRKDMDELRKENAELKKQLGEVAGVTQAQVRQQEQSYARRIEKCFAKYPELFGAGPIEKLNQKSPEFFLRIAANAAHQEAGGTSEDLDENIDTFVKSRFGRREQPEQTDEAAEWEEGVLGTPSSAGPREAPPSREKAVQGIRSKLQGIGNPRPTRGAYLKHNRSQVNGEG